MPNFKGLIKPPVVSPRIFQVKNPLSIISAAARIELLDEYLLYTTLCTKIPYKARITFVSAYVTKSKVLRCLKN